MTLRINNQATFLNLKKYFLLFQWSLFFFVLHACLHHSLLFTCLPFFIPTFFCFCFFSSLRSCHFPSPAFTVSACALPPLLSHLLLSFFFLSVSLSSHLPFPFFKTFPWNIFSLPACMMACSWEPLFLCKLLAWLQQYLKLNHKLCCQTNRQALGQHGSAVFFCLFFFFFAFVLVVFGEGGCADPSSQPQQALGFRWPGSSGGVGRRVMWRMKGPTDMRDSAADPETAQNSSRGVKQSYWDRRIVRLGQREGRVQPTQRETWYHGKDKQREAMSWSTFLIQTAVSETM